MRLALRLLAACSIALLAACSGSGGYGFNGATTTGNSNNIQSIQFYGTGNAEGVFKLLSPPGYSITNTSVATPISVTATGYTGGGTVAVIVPDTVYTWSIGYTYAPTTYQGTGAGAVSTCPAKPAAPLPGLSSLGVVTPIGSAAPSTFDILQLPTNVSGNGGTGTGVAYGSTSFSSYAAVSPNAATQTIYVDPVPGAAAPYCLLLVATHTGDGKQGTQVIYVTTST